MKKTFVLDNKIFWYANISQAKSYEDIVLPSFAKKVKKSLKKFEENFEYEIVGANEELFWDKFVPLYKKYVVSKPTYHLDEEAHYQRLLEKLTDSNYGQFYFLFIKSRDGQKLVGVTLFVIKNKHQNKKTLSFVNKGYDHSITKQFKMKASLDYFSEMFVQNFAIDNQCKAIFHGRDAHPHENAGLALFKLRSGAKPLSGLANHELQINRENITKIEYNFEDLQKQDVSIMFDEPGEFGLFQKAYLLSKSGVESTLQVELKKNIEKRNLFELEEFFY